jgi:TM2 domain-containing membrane protein YozV
VRHSGRVWIGSDETSATEGAIEVEPGVVTLWVNESIVGEWSHAAMRIVEVDHGFTLSADGDELRFVPDDVDTFMSDTAAIRFKSRMKPATPEPTMLATTASPAPPMAVPVKNPGVAAVLSFFWPGLGQIYNGEIGKGVLFIVVQVINAFLIVILVGFVTGFIVWVLGMVDAYQVAERQNAAHATSG